MCGGPRPAVRPRARFPVCGQSDILGSIIVNTPIAALLLASALAAAEPNRGVIDTSSSPHVQMRTFDLGAVRWTRGFWADRFDRIRTTSLPAMWKVMHDHANSSNFVNLSIAAGLAQGAFRGQTWSDGDAYKLIETMAAVWLQTRDPQLDRLMDEAISIVSRAQAPDGYIGTQTQLTSRKRWGHIEYHELYNMGHLITAACIHHRATGKTNFLAVARKTADYLHAVFHPQPPELAHFDFNPAQVMGLVELYRVTGERKYLDLAHLFTLMRGSRPGGRDENQARVPLRRETEAVGHAVTGPYLWAGATDVYAETGEKELWSALVRLWEDVSYRKMYITGGTAAINFGASIRNEPVHEAFGFRYQFPNAIAYNESCANIAHAMWSWRMLGVAGEARYADVMEQVLYNSFLSSWGLDGATYCYTNVLRRHGKEDPLLKMDSYERWPSTTAPGAPNCYCCPPNVTRTVAELGGWAYGWSNRTLWVNLYGGNTLRARLPGAGPVELTQETDYPWQGLVRITIQRPAAGELSIRLRIPGWAERASLKLNGRPAQAVLKPGTYAEVRRAWRAGDTLELDLPMEPRLVEAHPKAEELRNQVAVVRGPVVYCLESHDLPPAVKPLEVGIPLNSRLSVRHDPALLGGVTVMEGRGRLLPAGDWTGRLYRSVKPAGTEAVSFRLVPYYAWNNRGVSHMSVWLPLLR